MKNKTEKILFLLLLTFSSCSSIYRFAVDVQEPAAVTLPVSAQNVLILDNAVKQPINYGIERTHHDKPIRADFPLSLDSTTRTAINEIAGALEESHFFKTVAVYKDPIRQDTTEWLSISRLSPEDQSDFYNMGDYDVLLVINRLLFSIKENVSKMQTGISYNEETGFVDLRADGFLTCSIYSYGKDNPLTTFTISDSLFTKSIVDGDSTVFFTAIPEYMLHELSGRLGNQAAQRYIPNWKTVERTIFTGYDARMQEAGSYAIGRQWKKAESLWTVELGKKKKAADKTKIAFNLAIANEMQDKLDSAYTWVQKAKEYLGNANQNSKETKLINQYIPELEQRIQNNRLLDIQWGKE
jgi:hypothetical protein